MYHGKADVFQEDLDTFLLKAEELQLKGLTGGAEEKNKEEQKVTDNTMPKIITTKKTEVVTEYLEYENKEELNKYNSHDSTETNTAIMKMSPAS